MDKYAIYIDIAVSPAVKKFIADKYPVDPFVVSTTNCYGIFLHESLAKLKCAPTAQFDELKPEIYSEKLDLAISEDKWRRQGWYIHPKKQYYFNRMVEQLMMEHFSFYMSVNTIDLGRRQYNSFLNFRAKFDMSEDELPLKTMEKRWERERKLLTA